MNRGEKLHDGGHLFAASTGGGFEKINLVGMHHDQNRAKGQGAYTGEYFDQINTPESLNLTRTIDGETRRRKDFGYGAYRP